VGKEQPPAPARAPVDPPEVLARIEEGLELVRILARSMRRQLGPDVTVEDLSSSGHEALLAAARTYDPDRGVPFRKWAALRIRGAMIDTARQNGSLPKRVYRRLRAIQAADLVHDAANEEQAAAPPRSAEDADAKLGDQLASAAMAAAIGLLAMRNTEALERARDPNPSPESDVGHAELLERIKRAIAERPDQERRLIERHYFEDVSFEDAAKELGLSKSWASRLHARAIEGIARSLKRARVTI
jgi:RNA polymerase sigma factor for flagellar operon FliA